MIRENLPLRHLCDSTLRPLPETFTQRTSTLNTTCTRISTVTRS